MPFHVLHQILSGTTSPALPIGITIGGAALLFLLSQVAMRLYRAGDISVSAKRIYDLNPRILRLSFMVRNDNRKPYALYRLRFAVKEGSQWKLIDSLTLAPIQRSGAPTFIRKEAEGYSFIAPVNTSNEVVLECGLPCPMDEIYLVAEDAKGKTVSAKINLTRNETQGIVFRKN